MSIHIPSALERLRPWPGAAAWLDELPAVVDRCVARWSLEVGQPYDGASVSWVAPVALPGGRPAVLKLQLPDRDSEHEGAALTAWGGNGAVLLLDADDDDNALLLERCEPGERLSTRPADDALDVLAELLPRLWVAADKPFRRLSDEAARWAADLPTTWERAGRPFPERLLREGVEALQALACEPVEPVLLHQDLHADNVVRARREPWLAIDPKPLVGDPAFGLAPIIRSYELGHSRQAVRRRLDLLSDRVGVDRERARCWALGHTLAWAFEGTTVLPRHIETATWLSSS